MNIIATNSFFEVSTQNDVAILNIRDKVFDFITNVDLSDQLLDFLDSIDHDPKIKALLFYNEIESLGDEQYDEFINRILKQKDNLETNEPPCFTERNLRFREINILNRIIRKIAGLQKLVISGIQGTVVTPFVGAAMVADFRYATEGAVFSMAHNRYGLHPSGGLPFFLTRFMNHSKAMEVQLSDKILVEEALELGLLNKILDADKFLDNMLEEIKKYTRIQYCTIRDTKRLTSFSRKALNGYFEFEAGLLNL